MRWTLLATLTAFALLLAPLAAASGHGPEDKEKKIADKLEKKADKWAQKEDRAAAKLAWIEKMHAWYEARLASWHENSTKIRAECAELPHGENATKAEQKAWSKCLREGYHGFFKTMREERRAMHDARPSR